MDFSHSFLVRTALILLIVTGPGTSGCPDPYTWLNGFCLYWDMADMKTWCDSARFCQSINGELAIGVDRARAARYLSSTLFYLGGTDFLVERYRNRTGWLMTNGQEFPLLGDDDWSAACPDCIDDSDDVLAVRSSGIMDATSGNLKKYLCQPVETPNSSMLERADFLKLGNITPNYCFTDITIEREFTCLNACVSRWECRAALVNTDAGRCRMLDYSDSSVGDAIELDPAWKRYVKVY